MSRTIFVRLPHRLKDPSKRSFLVVRIPPRPLLLVVAVCLLSQPTSPTPVPLNHRTKEIPDAVLITDPRHSIGFPSQWFASPPATLCPASSVSIHPRDNADVQIAAGFLLAAVELLSFPVDVIATVLLDSLLTVTKENPQNLMPRVTVNAERVSPVAAVRLLEVVRIFQYLRTFRDTYSTSDVPSLPSQHITDFLKPYLYKPAPIIPEIVITHWPETLYPLGSSQQEFLPDDLVNAIASMVPTLSTHKDSDIPLPNVFTHRSLNARDDVLNDSAIKSFQKRHGLFQTTASNTTETWEPEHARGTMATTPFLW